MGKTFDYLRYSDFVIRRVDGGWSVQEPGPVWQRTFGTLDAAMEAVDKVARSKRKAR